MWNGLYRTDIIRQHGPSFDETLVGCMDDFLFNLEFLKHVNFVVLISECGYIHYGRVGQSVDERYNEGKIGDIDKAAERERAFLLSQPTLNKPVLGFFHTEVYAFVSTAAESSQLCFNDQLDERNLEHIVQKITSLKAIHPTKSFDFDYNSVLRTAFYDES